MAEGVRASAPGLGRRAAQGAAASMGGQGARIVIQVGAVSLLARLLPPEDFGLVAMVVVVIGLGEIFRDFGLSSAAVQSPTLSRAQRDNLWWLNTGIGALLCGALVAAAPAVAAMYDRPELTNISRWLAISFLLNGMTTQYRADLTRRLRFTPLALADVAAPAVALLVAALMAFGGAGYWALVTQQLVSALVPLVMLAGIARWLPRGYTRDAPMRSLLRFGWATTGSAVINYGGNNLATLIIGVQVGPAALGLYNRAYKLIMAPLGQLRSPTATVALPILSKLHDDAARFREFVRLGQLALGYTLVVGLGLIVATAEPVTAVFLGPQWAEAVPLIRLMAAAGIFQTLAFVGYWVYLSRALLSGLVKLNIVQAVVTAACVLAGSHWGLIGVACGFAVSPALMWPVSLWWLDRQTDFPLRALTLGAVRILAFTSAATATAWVACDALAGSNALVRIGASAIAVALIYGAGATIPWFRRDLRSVEAIARLAVTRGRRTDVVTEHERAATLTAERIVENSTPPRRPGE